MVRPVFGTAHLFATVSAVESRQLLHAAVDAGFTAFDTAPSYGYGFSEPAVGEIVSGSGLHTLITTKVGLLPAARPGLALRTVKAAARRLPGSVQTRLRPSGQPPGSASGRFGVDAVRSSIEESLHRLGHIDRLMLHEVLPADIDEELLACLAGYAARGDVDVLGTATANELTQQCVARAPELLTAAHVAIGLDAAVVELPATVTVRVGHGVLGPGGATLRRLTAQRDSDADLQRRWQEATSATRWAGPTGLADVLIARAAAGAVTDVIAATSRVERLRSLHDLLTCDEQPPDAVLSLLEVLRSAPTSG